MSSEEVLRAELSRQLAHPPDLEGALSALVAAIPHRRVTTFGRLASGLGSRQAAMWVARTIRAHSHTPVCRCHRVVRHDGTLPRWNSDQTERLQRDGITVSNDLVDLGHYLLDVTTHGVPPLNALIDLQARIGRAVGAQTDETVSEPRAVRQIAGVDLSYSGDRATATAAIVDYPSLTLLGSVSTESDVGFPYIPSFLAYRELPALVSLVDRVADTAWSPDVWIVDGSGQLHPRRAGIATMLGFYCRLPTIGITKRRLTGGVAGTDALGQCVVSDGDELGYRLHAPAGGQPIYVSPGFGVSRTSAAAWIRRLHQSERLPRPIHWADQISRKLAKQGSHRPGSQSSAEARQPHQP